MRYVMAKGRVDSDTAVKDCGQSASATLVRLYNGGYLSRTTELNESRAPVVETVSVAPEYSEYSAERLCAQVRGSKQKEALSVLTVTGEMSVNELRDRYDVARSVIKPLVDKGILILKKEDSFRDPYKGRKGSEDKEFVLSDEQKKARDVIIGLIKSGEPKAALLHGVTGSGKTSVIREVMDYVVNSGRSVILLVPEISLTPQTIAFFSSSFGEYVFAISKSLTIGALKL